MTAYPRSTRGETMIEVLVALIILIVGAFGALRLFQVSIVGNQITKERVIATNLAREGIEAVRSIRDTNWLRYAGERRKCWNNLDVSTCADVGSGVTSTPIAHRKSYTVDFKPENYRWQLKPISEQHLDLASGLDDSLSYQLRISPTTGLYSHTDGVASIYFREIFTEYLNEDQTAASGPEANLLRVTAKVEWSDRGRINDVILSTILTDYLGRSDHN